MVEMSNWRLCRIFFRRQFDAKIVNFFDFGR